MPQPILQRGTSSPATYHGLPLAWHLGPLCAALLLPMLVLAVFLFAQVNTSERALQEMSARETARRFSLILDRELTMLQGSLELLAASHSLQRGNLAAFYERAATVPRLTGSAVLLRDRDGRRLVDTRVPWGTALGDADTGGLSVGDTDPEADRVAAQTGQAQISSFLPGKVAQTSVFTVVVSAPWAGPEHTYLLSMVVPIQTLAEILHREGSPPSTTTTIYDRRGVVLARNAEGELYADTPIPPGAWASMRADREGWVRMTDIAGVPVVLAFARSEVAGWTTAVLMPEAKFEAPLRRSLWAWVSLATLLVALAATLAVIFARRIARPIVALVNVAAHGEGNGVADLATPLREVNEVGHALAAARTASLQREQEREDVQLTLDHAQVLVRGLDGRIIAWTAGDERIYGWTRAEAVGRVWHELLRTEFPRPLSRIEAELLASGEWQGELRNRRRDGAEVVVASHWSLRRASDGEPLAVAESFNDVTALRVAENRAQRMQTELMYVSRLSAMGAMGAALAHELNQPLTATANFANAARRLLAGAMPPTAARIEDARQAMAEAADEAVRAGKIVRHLRELVTRGDGEKRLCSINACVEASAVLALAGSSEQGVTARFEYASQAPSVLVDSVQIQQVLVNLIRNAVEAVQDTPRRELVMATTLINVEMVEVSVADTGPGLSEEIARRLFEPFVTTKRHGMGIGLSICRFIIEQHGGRLTVEANPGGGAVFRFTLLLALETAHAD